jgi:predicted metal-dependent phosphoesterase TrpH
VAADLHVHTSLSDGTHPPEEVAELAGRAGLKTIAITDHDVVDGVAPARKKGNEIGVEVIPGIEFSTETPGAEVHILGYFVNCADLTLTETLGKVQEDRVRRVYKIVEKLKALKVEIEAEDVLAISGKKAPGRPHVARALINRGAVATFKEAFNRYLDFRSPAYVPHYKLVPADAIGLIKRAGGIAVFAHPGTSNCDELIPGMINDGLRGLEVYYSGHGVSKTRHYLDLAKKLGLLVTGGSDFHGVDSGREVKLGELTIPDRLVEKLKDEHLHRN